MSTIDVVPSDSRYVPLTQQRWCCVPACISMVMYRHNIPLVPQELIGYHLGVIVPEEELAYFWNGVSGEKPPSGWGTRTGLPQYEVNKALDNLEIPLKCTKILIDSFHSLKEFEDYLGLTEKNDKDVLACFDWGVLNGEDKHNGHLCVIDRVYLSKSEIRLLDPEYKSPKWKTVSIKVLKEAMEFHGDPNSAGFWEFSKV